MIRFAACLMILQMAVGVARAGMARERWAGDEVLSTHPGTMEAVVRDETPQLRFDLSALPRKTRVLHASLCNKIVRQPREAIRIHAITGFDKGKPRYATKAVELEAPGYASFDVTEVVRAWVEHPANNLGLAFSPLGTFDLHHAYLEISYDGASRDPPPQVADLQAVHHDGQTFLTWQEMASFRPKPEEVVWAASFAKPGASFQEPGTGFMGSPRLQAVTLGTLRRLQMYDVIDPPAGTQDYPHTVRKPGWPDVQYRVYRHAEKITAANLKDAELLGVADPLCALDESMYRWSSHGEYYDKREVNESLIPTFCLSDGKSIPAGHAYYAATAVATGAWFYAVTVVKNGAENTADVGDPNSLSVPVAEKPGPLRPVFQYAEKTGFVKPTHERNLDMQNPVTQHKYYVWIAPPLCNAPSQAPQRVYLCTAPGKEEHPGLYLDGLLAIAGFVGLNTGEEGLCYNAGRGTFRSYTECKVDYFPERYKLALIQWTARNWNVDLSRVQAASDTHFAIRHPDMISAFWPNRPAYYQADFDQKWNPSSTSLLDRMGAADAAMTVDGQRAWDVVDMTWYVKQNPGRDVPFFGCFFSQPKGGNHGAEYGWQDDPKGWAALRDTRQPFVAQWGGNHVSGEVQDFLYFKVRWDRPVPAFSNGSLDNNPGNGDPADGDLFGQINGYLIWDSESAVDEASRFEMTVQLVDRAPEAIGAVDITPRHCKAFKPKAGEKFMWTNTSLADNKAIQSAELLADAWGLVTMPAVVVSKTKNRMVLVKK